MDLELILNALREVPLWLAYLILFTGAFGEYVFPPIPGDLIVLAGAVLVAVFGWPVIPVFLLVTVGAVLGAMVDYFVGRWIERTGRLEKLSPRKRLIASLLVEKFEQYGSIYLIINRFVPGIRGFFFIAAGLARLRPWTVALWATLGAVAWNLVLFALGLTLGHNLDTLEKWLVGQGWVMGVLFVGGISAIGFWLWRKVKEREASILTDQS